MGKERGKKMYVGIVFNYAAELKLLLAALFLLCPVATLLQFLPSRFPVSGSDLRFASPLNGQMTIAAGPPNQLVWRLPGSILASSRVLTPGRLDLPHETGTSSARHCSEAELAKHLYFHRLIYRVNFCVMKLLHACLSPNNGSGNLTR